MSSLFLAKIRLAAGAGLAGAAAILIGVTLAGPTFGRAQRNVQVGGAAHAFAGIAPKIVQPVRTGAPRIGGRIPTDPSTNPGDDQGNRDVVVPVRRLSALGKQVEAAIRQGVDFLKAQQKPDGSWADIENDARTGVTSMVTLALLSAEKKPDSQAIKHALEYLRRFSPGDLQSTYAISLQTMVYAAVDPAKDEARIRANVEWLEEAQIKPDPLQFWPGSWSYSALKQGRPGDNSNTQYALLGLHAASEIGIPVKQSVWELAHKYWQDQPETRRKLGVHARCPEPDRQHDLRRRLQFDHFRVEEVPEGRRVRSRCVDRAVWPGQA